MKRTFRARAFLWSLVVVALISFDYWVATWKGPVDTSLVTVGALLVLMAVAVQAPLSFTPRHRVVMAPAVIFATMLVCPMPIALLVVAAGQALGGIVLSIRRRPSLRGRGWEVGGRGC